MKKLVLLGSTILITFLASPSFDAEAGNKYTRCSYELVAGAPWAERYKDLYPSGHVQCASGTGSAIGYYKLVSQTHFN